MKFPLRPGKVTCVGLVGILLVLPNSIWKSPSADAKVRIVSAHAMKTPNKIR
jgi:hypothetical protein